MCERVEAAAAGEHFGGDRRGGASSRVASEPVRHREQGAVGEIPILVLATVQAHVAGRSEVEAHARMLVATVRSPGGRAQR